MSCCSPDEERKNSRALDQQIRKDRKKLDEEIKLLLLGLSFYIYDYPFGALNNICLSNIPGAGESGKSTFAKQMRILHLNGFDDGERSSFRMIIRKNIIDSVRTLIEACREFHINLQQENQVLYRVYYFRDARSI